MNYNKLFLSCTDTVVGLGGPMNKETEEAIFKLKERSKEKPLLIMVSSIEEARKFEGWNSNAEELSKKYWPGQLTIVLDKVGIRIPDSKELIELMNKIGPIYMTSANKERTTNSWHWKSKTRVPRSNYLLRTNKRFWCCFNNY